MSLRTSLTTLCLAATVSLALAGTALGAPAGQEYVPFVPGAAGAEVVGGGENGPGSSILSPEVRGSGAGSKGDSGAKEAKLASSTSNDDSGAVGTLTDPVALLVIVGVGTAALAMTLRRRRSPAAAGGADLAGRDPGSSPTTPDGEIVGE